ncbi:MAG: anti-sigma F factor [Clostridia bacterium]|nr:anti-sigma F factor [Clostridia bacterium]MDD4047680.1 anti-sigma F factor [Clostridia bacterium]
MENIVNNRIKLELLSKGENVSLARITIAAFVSQLNLTLNDLEEIKVAVSEAVSNSIIHGYQNETDKFITIIGTLYTDKVEIEVADNGIGIPNIKIAMEPTFSTDPERMGLGFVFMQSFMDEVRVESKVDYGTKVILSKKINSTKENIAVS